MEELRKKYSFLGNWLTSSFNRKLLTYILIGVLLIIVGIFLYKYADYISPTKVEVLNDAEEELIDQIVVEITGEVIRPGVYKLPPSSRVDDLLIISGGLSADADRETVEKYLNRAAKLTDGQKIVIPSANQQTLGVSARDLSVDQNASSVFSGQNINSVNINVASLQELDKLPGIGPVYGQRIIDHRPYSTVEELLSRQVLKKNVYEDIKNMVSVY